MGTQLPLNACSWAPTFWHPIDGHWVPKQTSRNSKCVFGLPLRSRYVLSPDPECQICIAHVHGHCSEESQAYYPFQHPIPVGCLGMLSSDLKVPLNGCGIFAISGAGFFAGFFRSISPELFLHRFTCRIC